MDSPSFIVDFQGFKSSNDFIFKEVAILTLEQESIPYFFFFQSPILWQDLSKQSISCIRWLEQNYHGIRYSSGDIPYNKLQETLESTLGNAVKIYVKGSEKKKCLQDLLPFK